MTLAPVEARSQTPQATAAAKKVLIIDDTEEVRMLISESLKIYGFNILVAEDGQKGIEVAKEHLPDLIICDIRMPIKDGYQTLTSLRENEATTTIPFIFLSGASEKIDMRKGMELGADDYLTKPFTHKELMAAVNARLEKQADFQRQSEKKLDELRGNITMALPHELRTPLNGILGLASLMIDDHATMPKAEVLESAKFIHESALRLHRLIENFLVYSQIQLMATKKERIDTSGAVNPIAAHEVIPELARPIAKRYKRESDLDLHLASASLLIPPDNFRKIIEELVENAFKFSERGKPVHVISEITNSTYHITIADHGRGMTPEQIARIGPHIQFDRKIYEQQGAGLGLIIAKRLTELLGGQFSLHSKPGVETTVKVSFAIVGH
jgi:two-component system, sensor histidine kinase and response regulator